MRGKFIASAAAVAVAGAVTAVAVGLGGAAANAGGDAERGGGHEAAGPLVIAHRGASGYRPEHTLAAYKLAIQLGADFVEPDLVSTKDGVLVARHENEISGTTDVSAHPEFAARKATKVIDGVSVTGWWTEDFTLAELKTLRAKERLPLVRTHNTAFDGRFEVPTLQEVIDLVRQESRARNRQIGIYPEVKHPTYFRTIGLPLEERLVRVLQKNNLSHRNAKVFLQSFEPGAVKRLSRLTEAPVVALLDAAGRPYDFTVAGDTRTYADLATPAGLTWLKQNGADGVGLNKNLIVPRTADGHLAAPTTVIADAHARKLLVHAWTFRAENQFLPVDFRWGTDPNAWGDLRGELEYFYSLGLDGVFADFPDLAVAARGV